MNASGHGQVKIEDKTATRVGLSEKARKTLSLVCDTIVPKVETKDSSSSDFYLRKASEIGVDRALEEIIETKLEPSLRIQFQRLLSILDSRAYNLLLSGRPTRFSDLSFEERTKYLQGWRDSRIGSKRTGFQALKRLVCFLFYTLTDEKGSNPNWGEIGYVAPNEKQIPHPEPLRIKPLEISGNTKLECDVCMVGSGAGGSLMAHELSRAGYRVIVVESGPYATSEDFDQHELSMMNKLFDDYGTASTRDLSVILLSGRGAGGGTTVNWMTCIKPTKEILSLWENEFGIQGLTGSEFQSCVEEVWSTLKINLEESQMNFNNRVLWEGCSSLGYIEGKDYEKIPRNAVGCKERCAYCTYGCVYSCKQSTLLNYIPMAYSNGAKFIFNAKVERILIEGEVAKGVQARQGEFELLIKSKIVVVAAGSIKTPALLLNSQIKQKNIGKHLRLHPTTAVAGMFREEVRAWDGPPQTVVVTKFLDLENSGRGFWVEAAPAHPGLSALGNSWLDGKSHKEFMRERFNHSTANIVLLKEWSSGLVEIDRHGSPIVSYRMNQKDRENLIRGIDETARILVAAGARGLSTLHSVPSEVSSSGEKLTQNELDRFLEIVKEKDLGPNRITLFSAHIMGSCRMASSESLGAVDLNGEVYGVRNLFVGDSSVFPTSLGANPMVTIMAMTKRTSSFIINRLKEMSAS